MATPPVVAKVVAANVRSLLAYNKIPRAKVADALGMSYAQLKRRLTDTTEFSLDETKAVAKLLGLTLDQITTPMIGEVKHTEDVSA